MRVFFDTEFIEDGTTIDLLSIGLVREDGRTYYGQSLACQTTRASPWVQEHVLSRLHRCDRPLSLEDELGRHRASGRPCSSMCAWRSRAELRQEIEQFVAVKPIWGEAPEPPEFWADYASYDWVALCQLYGSMMDLPDHWPMYCRDVQQSRDELCRGLAGLLAWPPRAAVHRPEHHALNDARDCKDRFEFIEAERQRRWDVAGVRGDRS